MPAVPVAGTRPRRRRRDGTWEPPFAIDRFARRVRLPVRGASSDVNTCFFVSDLHGRPDRYAKLWKAVLAETPAAVFLGGDLLPSGLDVVSERAHGPPGFVAGFLAAGFATVRERLGPRSPRVFLILGNDDDRSEEESILEEEARGLWTYLHGRRAAFAGAPVLGYGCVPPTPFLDKDWERYDVSRYVPPGAVSPEEGRRRVTVPENEVRYGTIQQDLERLAAGVPMEDAILLFHTPPYETALDRAANDGRSVDHVPLDLHVGSIAVRRFIERHEPRLALHGHVHESARLTGSWKDRIGRTVLFGAAHDGEGLALVRFDLDLLEGATREIL